MRLDRPDSPLLDLPRRGHIPALDGLRGVAVLLVMSFHFTHGWVYGGPVGSVLAHVMHAGWIGVDLFFVLSGFLITGILSDTRGARNYFVSFYGRRTLRIFPLYFAVLACLWIASALIGGVSERMTNYLNWQPWLWWYGSNFAVAYEGRWLFDNEWFSANHFWSLAVEEHFYLIWPFVIAVCPPRRAMRVCLACIAIATGVRVGLLLTGSHPIANYVSTLCRFDSLAIGGLLALVCRDVDLRDRVIPTARRIFVVAGLLLGGWLLGFGLDKYHPAMQIVGYPLTSLFFAALLILLVDRRLPDGLARVIDNRATRYFGKYSYGMYIFHALFVHWLTVQQPRISAAVGSAGGGRIAYLAIVFGFTIAASKISWRLLESPMLSLKKHFTCETPQPVVNAA